MGVENIHIKQIEIENYKSLRDVSITFKQGLNIIIGQNGAGKSNLLEFIYRFATRNYLISRIIQHRNLNSPFGIIISYTENKKKNLLQFVIEKIRKNDPKSDTNSYYDLLLNKKTGKEKTIINETITLSDTTTKESLAFKTRYKNEFFILNNLNKTFIKFQYPNEALWISKPTKFSFDFEDFFTFEDSDYNFDLTFNLESKIEFYFIKKLDKEKIKDSDYIKKQLLAFIEDFFYSQNLNSTLNQYSPIQAIRLNPNINVYSNQELIIVENLTIDFLINNNWMPWSYLSDGTKRLFHLITEISDSADNLVLIEEPELGIHPHQLFKLLNFIKEQSSKKQIIISTHSPSVLDMLNENELDRITIAKYDKGTKFIKLTKPQIAKAKEYISLVGDLSYYWLHSDLEQ
jgi:AAA15 family ATPase/GTPase